jgi:Na+-driven multidrug efflux pump
MSQRAIFYIVGMMLGIAGGIVMTQSFSEDHPRKVVLRITIPLALVGGLILGWALNAWIDYVHASATSPMQ